MKKAQAWTVRKMEESSRRLSQLPKRRQLSGVERSDEEFTDEATSIGSGSSARGTVEKPKKSPSALNTTTTALMGLNRRSVATAASAPKPYRLPARINELARPKVAKESSVPKRDPFSVSQASMRYEPSDRIKRLATSQKTDQAAAQKNKSVPAPSSQGEEQ